MRLPQMNIANLPNGKSLKTEWNPWVMDVDMGDLGLGGLMFGRIPQDTHNHGTDTRNHTPAPLFDETDTK